LRRSVAASLRRGWKAACSSARPPLLAAARVLLAGGVAPDTRIAMRHAGSEHDALRSTVGKAAKLTVKETANGPKFRRWRAQETGPDRPPIAWCGDKVPLQPPAPDALYEAATAQPIEVVS
jgi:hypothetical protein